MVDGVHADTADVRPAVALGLVLVVGAAGLHDGLVGTATTGDDADGGAAVGRDDLLGARGQPDAGLVGLGVLAEDGGVVAGGAGERAAVADLLLDVADDGTLGEGVHGEDVADGEGGLLAAVDKLAGVETLGGDEGLLPQLVAVAVVEDDAGQGGTTAGVVDDLLDHSADVAVALNKVEGAQLGGTLPVVGVGLEDATRSLALSANTTTHPAGVQM
mmetsp:Transcript_25117/g.24868  ORF Transcript_25117/g.24868 Transcript_25117/m.24868 type:complete len:216 (+) Transcript_25117:256-903(+)